jgi:hypothetical protein
MDGWMDGWMDGCLAGDSFIDDVFRCQDQKLAGSIEFVEHDDGWKIRDATRE